MATADQMYTKRNKAPLWPVEPDRRWKVGFIDVDEDSGNWVRRVLSWLPYPRHCLAYRNTPGGLLIVQQTLSRLLVVVQEGATERDMDLMIMEAGGSVEEVLAPHDAGFDGWMPRPFSCTCIVRALARLPWRLQTPAGLARELRANRRGPR